MFADVHNSIFLNSANWKIIPGRCKRERKITALYCRFKKWFIVERRWFCVRLIKAFNSKITL